jgi:hypothetical protein
MKQRRDEWGTDSSLGSRKNSEWASPCVVLAGTAASGDEVNDERDHGEEDQQMNKKAADMHHEEAADPKHSQNDCDD